MVILKGMHVAGSITRRHAACCNWWASAFVTSHETQAPMRPAGTPASTTPCASSGVCLAMSLSAEAATRFRDSSGSCTHSTSSGTAPASTTCQHGECPL